MSAVRHRAQLRLDLLLEHGSRSRGVAVGGSAGRRSAASHVLGRLGHVDGVLRRLVDSPERRGDVGVPAHLGADGVELAHVRLERLGRKLAGVSLRDDELLEALRPLHLLAGRRGQDGRQASLDLLVQRGRRTASRGRRSDVVLVEELEGVPAVVRPRGRRMRGVHVPHEFSCRLRAEGYGGETNARACSYRVARGSRPPLIARDAGKGDAIQEEGIRTESTALRALEHRLPILLIRPLLVRRFEHRRKLRDGVVHSRRTRTTHRSGRDDVREVRGKRRRNLVVPERLGHTSLALFRKPRLELGHVLGETHLALLHGALHQRQSLANILWGRIIRRQILPGEFTEALLTVSERGFMIRPPPACGAAGGARKAPEDPGAAVECEKLEGPAETAALPPTLASPVTRTGSESSLSPSP